MTYRILISSLSCLVNNVAQPYISSTLLAEHEDDNKVLILACDGVWDVLTDQEAADLIIARMLEKGGPDAEAAEFLVNTAIERGSADNVTAIVAYL
jgi:serine/threonine protein phosphatase PrpC